MVDVDVSDVVRFDKEAAKDLRGFANRMKRTLDRAAREERSTHAYQNRTHNLEDSTKAYIAGESLNSISIDLAMGMPYASFVIGRGFSDFPTYAEAATDVIAADAERMGAKASG